MSNERPLKWPDGWPRLHCTTSSSKFRVGGFGGSVISFDLACSFLMDELRKLDASDVVISSNQGIRNIRDVGVALYFTRNKRQIAIACDRYDTLGGNARSIGLAIEGLRQLERHGGDHMMDKAFEGFAALPSPERPWQEVLGFSAEEIAGGLLEIDVASQYRRKAARIHANSAEPERHLRELNIARDQALEAIKGDAT